MAQTRTGRAVILFLLWLAADVFRHRVDGQDVPAFLTVLSGITLVSFIYLIYYIISEKLYEEILGSMVVSLVLMGLTAIFFPFGVLLFIWIAYNLVLTLRSMVSMLLPAVLTLLVLALLFPVPLAESAGEPAFFIARPLVIVGPLLGTRYNGALTIMDVLYLAIALVYAWRTSVLPLKHALLRLSFSAGSVGLLLVSICAVINGLRSMFETNWIVSSRDIRVSQNVSGYMRGGTVVDSYQREVTRSVTQVVPVTSVGSGAATIGTLGATTATLRIPDEKPEGDPVN